MKGASLATENHSPALLVGLLCVWLGKGGGEEKAGGGCCASGMGPGTPGPKVAAFQRDSSGFLCVNS